MSKRVAFQGELGSYSHQACHETFDDYAPVPCATFPEALATVRSGAADLGMIAVENSTYGRVADVHSLLPHSGLHIIGEAFVRVHINLLALPGTALGDVRRAMSHTVLLGQCRSFLDAHSIKPVTGADTAGSAKIIAEEGDPATAALASELAGEIYGLEVLARHIEDQQHNRTRFLIMSREPDHSERGDHGMITSFVFEVRNIPAALYKAMGGFATNGINMIKLESYMVDGTFRATQFYAEVEGHPSSPALARALDELDYFTSSLEILGVFPADPRRP